MKTWEFRMKRLLREPLIALSNSNTKADLQQLRGVFDHPGISAAYLFGSLSRGSTHPLSDIDVAYLGTDSETEDQLYDSLYESLQHLLGEGNFDLVPLRRTPLHLQFHVAMEGMLLLARDAIAVEAFSARAIMRYLDFKPYRDAYFAAGA
jgi:predicted nucleotidyltransferase